MSKNEKKKGKKMKFKLKRFYDKFYEKLARMKGNNVQKETKNNRYEKIRKLGEGSFGSVTKVFDHESQCIRALKKIKFTLEDEGVPVNAIREISILKTINHPNVVNIYDIHYNWDPCRLYICMEYVEENLYEHMKRNNPLSPYSVQSYAHQTLTGLYQMHQQGIMHRDIKPQNLMISSEGIVKLCDFGQSKIIFMNKDKYSLEVSSLWYRAPELLLGYENYNFAVDMWAFGCVLAEMVSGLTLFKSDCEVGQIFEIFKVFGKPPREMYPKWKFLSNEFPSFPKQTLKIPKANEKVMDLLEKILQIDPTKRLSSYQALKHPFFDGY